MKDDCEIRDTLDELNFIFFAKQYSKRLKLKRVSIKRTLRSPDFINCGKQREKIPMNNKQNWNIKPKEIIANNQEELISSWPWEYPDHIKESNKAGE